MDKILVGLPGVCCYLDDILISGKNEAEHAKNLHAVLERLTKHGLRGRPDKCEFFVKSVEYLGHILDGNGIKPKPNKLKAITEMPPPRNLSQLESFLGMSQYYGKFIKNF